MAGGCVSTRPERAQRAMAARWGFEIAKHPPSYPHGRRMREHPTRASAASDGRWCDCHAFMNYSAYFVAILVVFRHFRQFFHIIRQFFHMRMRIIAYLCSAFPLMEGPIDMKKQVMLKRLAAIHLDAFEVLCSLPASGEYAVTMTRVCSELTRLSDLVQAEPIRWNQDLTYEEGGES